MPKVGGRKADAKISDNKAFKKSQNSHSEGVVLFPARENPF